MTWRMARTLEVLLAEINRAAPKRSKISDGGIGDAAHAASTSDHNPWIKGSDGVGVVRARDFTHDPAGGLDCEALAAHLVTLLGQHPGLLTGAYLIWRRRIISASRLSEGWRPYPGSNSHDKHLHVSVSLTGYDTAIPYGWPPAPPKPPGLPKRVARTITEVGKEIDRVRLARKAAAALGEKRAPYTDVIRNLKAARAAARQIPKR